MKRVILFTLAAGVVLVDFTSRFLSIAVDGVFMLSIWYIANEMVKSNKENK
jgi:hypothetical protein